MFQNLVEIARELRSELVGVYWVLIVPLIVLLVIFEFFKEDQQPLNVVDILRRTVISVLLLVSFEEVMNTIAYIGDGILAKLSLKNNLWHVLSNLGPTKEKVSNDWFNLREHVLYALSVLAYIIAYLGFFLAEALTHFVWTILYIVSPLMILAYIPRQTAQITSNLYQGLFKVLLWKLLWTILGALLLKLAMEPQYSGLEDYLQSIVMNLCIGLSMLFIPIAAKSIINDGINGAASAIAVLPAMATAQAIKTKTMGLVKNPFDKKKNESRQQKSKPTINKRGI